MSKQTSEIGWNVFYLRPRWATATKQNPWLRFPWNTGWLVGILIMACELIPNYLGSTITDITQRTRAEMMLAQMRWVKPKSLIPGSPFGPNNSWLVLQGLMGRKDSWSYLLGRNRRLVHLDFLGTCNDEYCPQGRIKEYHGWFLKSAFLNTAVLGWWTQPLWKPLVATGLPRSHQILVFGKSSCSMPRPSVYFSWHLKNLN